MTVTGAVLLTVIEDVLLVSCEGNTVMRGVGDLVNGRVVGIEEYDRVRDTVILRDVLFVRVCDIDLVNDLVTVGERVRDKDFVSDSDFVRLKDGV